MKELYVQDHIMTIQNTLENKARFFALYWGQKVYREGCYLELRPLSDIKDEEAIEVARVLYGESENFAIEFSASGLTSVSPWGLPCYGDTVDIHWSGRISFERASELNVLMGYDFLRSRGFALPYMGVPVEALIEWGWVKIKGEAGE